MQRAHYKHFGLSVNPQNIFDTIALLVLNYATITGFNVWFWAFLGRIEYFSAAPIYIYLLLFSAVLTGYEVTKLRLFWQKQ